MRIIQTEDEFLDTLKSCAWWINNHSEQAESLDYLFYELMIWRVNRYLRYYLPYGSGHKVSKLTNSDMNLNMRW